MYLLAHLFAARSLARARRISLGAITLNHSLVSGRDKVRTVRQNHFRVNILYRRLPRVSNGK